jgi:hypothetical protein
MSFPTPPHIERLNKRKPNPVKPMNVVLNKLSEPSTVRGIIALLGAFGIAIDPQYVAPITAVVLGLVGIINVWRKESKIPKAEVVE